MSLSTFFLSPYAAAQIVLFLLITFILLKPLGSYIARVYSGQYILLESVFGPLEDFIYRIAKVDPLKEMTWQQYAIAVIITSFGGFLLLFGILSFQGYLPCNPQHFGNLSSDLAFNTAASFLTNTDWQSYSGETTLSYFSQMVGLTVQNFLSASTGIACVIALIRGITRKNTPYIGNYWVDWLRGNLYILLPLAFIWAILLGSQGVIQHFNPYTPATLLEPIHTEQGPTIDTQLIPGGPVASQVAIKTLGSNGGGFFNTNAAHPFENPTPFSNFIELIAILLIPSALCYTFGVMVNDKRQGWAILIAMTCIFIPLMLICIQQEQHINPQLQLLGIDQVHTAFAPGGNMEGKELRFGIVNSSLWAGAATATSNGSMNAMVDSFTPLGGMIPLIFIMLGEVIFGGVGSGLYGILIFVFITVFITGLMVGHTPEYLGKKIQSFEIKMSSIVILVPILATLFGASLCVLTNSGLSAILNPGSHGLTEIIYALASASNNNGSAFAGLNTNSPFYNTLLGLVFLFGRFWIIIPVLAIAGSLAEKNISPISASTMSTHKPLFLLFLIGVILIVGLLTYIPVLTLSPIADYFEWIH